MSQMGLVGIANNEYGDYCLEQLIKFPTGKYDDAVDMLALFGRAVDEAHPMITVPGIPETEKDRYNWDDDDTEYDWAAS